MPTGAVVFVIYWPITWIYRKTQHFVMNSGPVKTQNQWPWPQNFTLRATKPVLLSSPGWLIILNYLATVWVLGVNMCLDQSSGIQNWSKSEVLMTPHADIDWVETFGLDDIWRKQHFTLVVIYCILRNFHCQEISYPISKSRPRYY